MQTSIAALITVREAAQREILSARPDAPIVPDQPGRVSRHRTYRTRAALARQLARIADLVAPTDWVPAHRTASSR